MPACKKDLLAQLPQQYQQQHRCAALATNSPYHHHGLAWQHLV